MVTTQGATLSFDTQHAMTREFGGKWGSVLMETECLNTRLSLLTLLYAKHSVKLKQKTKKELQKNIDFFKKM